MCYEKEYEIAEIFIRHFYELFKANDNVEIAHVIDKVHQKLLAPMTQMLVETFRGEEIS